MVKENFIPRSAEFAGKLRIPLHRAPVGYDFTRPLERAPTTSFVTTRGGRHSVSMWGAAVMATTLAQSLRADPVSRLTLRPFCSVDASTAIDETLRCMVDRKVGCALVTESGKGGGDNGSASQLVGIFTERDFVDRVVAAELDVGRPISSVMTRSPKTIQNSQSIQNAIEMMEGGGYRHLPVLGEDAQPAGVLSVKDVVHYLVGYFPANVYNLPPTPQLNQPAREGA